jgi:hypothetical protein
MIGCFLSRDNSDAHQGGHDWRPGTTLLEWVKKAEVNSGKRPPPERIARARIKIGMASLVYNFQRPIWREGQTAPG